MKYPKGSEWRKWDLHIHSDCGTPQDILDKVIEKGISVFAVTDHTAIDNLDDFINIVNQKRQAGIDICILPGIELRTDKGKYSVHLIGIFPLCDNLGNKIDSEYLRQNLLAKIDCSTADIIEAGRSTLGAGKSDEEYIKRGKLEKVVNFEKAAQQMKHLGGLTVVHAGTKSRGIETDMHHARSEDDYEILGSIGHTKRELMKQSIDVCELPNWNDSNLEERDFYLNKFYKPSIIGSDSHTLGDIGAKFTWIKADPTFEGLKQIIYEPRDRVHLGYDHPIKVDPSKVIKSLLIGKSNDWFSETEIELNSDMISIIGGRGTGKTALLDMIALVANKNWSEIEDNDNSFLKKAEKKLPELTLQLRWLDGSSDSIELDKLDRTADPLSEVEKKAIYLSQGFVARLCSETYVEELQRQIEDVIHQKVKDEEKAIYSDFKSYKASQLQNVVRERKQIAGALTDINKDIQDKTDLIINKVKIEAELKKRESDLDKINKEIKEISDSISPLKKENEALLKKYKEHNEQKASFEQEIASRAKQVRDLDQVLADAKEIEIYVSSAIESLNTRLKALGIDTELSISVSPKDLSKIISKNKALITKEITEKTKQLNKINGEIVSIVKELNIEKTKQTRLVSLSNLQKKAVEEKNSYQKNLDLCNSAIEQLPGLKEKQLGYFLKYFVSLYKEKEVLQAIYKPLEDSLQQVEGDEKKLFKFDIKLDFDFRRMSEVGDKLIDHRKAGKFHNKDEKELFEELKKIKDKTFSLDLSAPLAETPQGEKKLTEENETGIKEFLSAVINLFQNDFNKDELIEKLISEQLSSAYSISNFYNWLFDTDYYRLTYSIQFDNKKLDELTPGLKGIALLILYLDLDKDYKPILIDQPEENLDNRSVYSTLMKYFRNAKKNRQVFIVTHNANLVVNTDSEQIFVANFDTDRTKQNANICYVSGSLENSFDAPGEVSILLQKGIRQHCWYVLEGGPIAFRMRERKHNLPREIAD